MANLAATRGKRRSKSRTALFSDTGTLSAEDSEELLQQFRSELLEKDSVINALTAELTRVQNELTTQTGVVHRTHPLQAVQYLITDGGRTTVTATKGRIGRAASILTQSILESTEEPSRNAITELCEKIINVFQNPNDNISYLTSAEFASDILRIADEACKILETEPRCYFLQSPVYVFGDIHGNLEDLHFFADNIWKLGISLTAGKFLFLGDYVDRGMSGLECITYLMAQKILNPDKVYMLRGNHETREVNGWEDHYGERSFLWQCKNRFGDELGLGVWEECNCVFDRLPLAAVIDHDIFCVHGGIPRPIPEEPSRIQALLSVPVISAVNPPFDHETEVSTQIISDCIWSDPACEFQEETLNADGFGESLRGGGAVCFGNQAITEFLREFGLSYIVRAHEAHAEGVAISKGARVFTVFSTSKDHGQGSHALAGCILVDFDKIQVINRSPAYKNKFVHRRTSSAVQMLDVSQLETRLALGLVVEVEQEHPPHPDEMDGTLVHSKVVGF